jgi:probable HAF family extracellular repeat protein
VKTIRTAVLAAALLLPTVALATPAQATATPRYLITDLGTLGTGTTAQSSAMAINNAGVVVGTTTIASGAQHGFRWSAANGMTDLGVIPGGANSSANAINDAGQVAGTADRQNGGYGYPVRWSASGVITDLGGTITNRLGVGNGIDPTGRVAGGQRAADSEGSPYAMLYDTSGGTVDLGTPPDSLGAANGINARGQVVGSPGFLWQNGTVTMLPNLAGVTGNGNATAINIRGQIVGESPVAGTYNTVGVVWNGTAITNIGTVDGIQYSQANAINASGEVVGTADPMCSPCVAPRAWFWRPGGTITALDTLLPAGSGWKLERANGVNDRGQIVGSGR